MKAHKILLLVAMWCMAVPMSSCMTDAEESEESKESIGFEDDDDAIMVEHGGHSAGNGEKQDAEKGEQKYEQKSVATKDPKFLADVKRARTQIRNYECSKPGDVVDAATKFLTVIEALLNGRSELGDDTCSKEAIVKAIQNEYINVEYIKGPDDSTPLELIFERFIKAGNHTYDLRGNNRFDLLEKVVWVLLMSGVPIKTQEPKPRRPSVLSMAVSLGNKNVCAMLLTHPNGYVNDRANVHEKGENGESPLHTAAQHGHREICQLLIDKNAKIDACDDAYCTPLTYAAKAGHNSVYALLIEAGARTDIIDQEGNTPASYYQPSWCVIQ